MLTPAVLWRRAADRIEHRDPERDALRRATRAGIVMPIAAAVSFTLGGQSQTPMFTIFGSVALLILADFPGNRPARALAYAGLGINGAVLITVGTLVAPYPWLSVGLMFVLGVAVMFAGVLSEIIAAGQRATLLTFVLPACTQPGPIDERLTGWLIALAVCVPAALFLFPPRHHDDLRRHAARVCRKLADCLEGTATTRDVTRAMNALYDTFVNADFRPVALTAGSRALVRVVDDLGWLSDRITDHHGALLGDMKPPIVRVLRDSRRGTTHPRRDRTRRARRRPRRGADRAARGRPGPLPGGHRADPRRARRRHRARRGPNPARPPYFLGDGRGDRTRHPQRRPGRRPAGLGPSPRPSAPADGRGRLGDAGDDGRRGHHQGLRRRPAPSYCRTVCVRDSAWHWPWP